MVGSAFTRIEERRLLNRLSAAILAEGFFIRCHSNLSKAITSISKKVFTSRKIFGIMIPYFSVNEYSAVM